MTDLVTLIKTAIENVPQRDGNGRIDTKAMAEAAAKVAVEEAAREALKWPDTYQDAVSAHAELMTTARIAAAIRSLIPPRCE